MLGLWEIPEATIRFIFNHLIFIIALSNNNSFVSNNYYIIGCWDYEYKILHIFCKSCLVCTASFYLIQLECFYHLTIDFGFGFKISLKIVRLSIKVKVVVNNKNFCFILISCIDIIKYNLNININEILVTFQNKRT